jgi:hypothetical protein
MTWDVKTDCSRTSLGGVTPPATEGMGLAIPASPDRPNRGGSRPSAWSRRPVWARSMSGCGSFNRSAAASRNAARTARTAPRSRRYRRVPGVRLRRGGAQAARLRRHWAICWRPSRSSMSTCRPAATRRRWPSREPAWSRGWCVTGATGRSAPVLPGRHEPAGHRLAPASLRVATSSGPGGVPRRGGAAMADVRPRRPRACLRSG